ncbi:pyridoxal phosphate-dependent aminotransferase [Ignavibacteriales bacterium]
MTDLSKLVSSVEGSATLAITALVKKLKAEGKDVLSFSAGEPDFPTPGFIKDAAIQAINENFTKYTANAGTPDLIAAIIVKFKNDNNLEYTPGEILVSSGAKQSIYNVLMALCNPGDEVIYQSPYWVSYPEMVKLVQGKSVVIDAGPESGYKITPAQLKAAITPKSKVFIFNSPSNPSGAAYSPEEIKALCEVLVETDIITISDEIYEKITFDGGQHYSPAQYPGLRDKTVVINGLSKAYSMTGWRVGYAAGPKSIIDLAANLQSHSTSNACSVSQKAATAALTGPTTEIEMMATRFQERRDLIIKGLREIDGIKCPVPGGAFYAFFDVSSFYGKSFRNEMIKCSAEMCTYLLAEENIGLVPGDAFGNDNCVRMSFACSERNIVEGLRRLKNGLEKLS